MSFEVIEHDLGGRLGRLKTKHGVVRTPALAPVVNPRRTPFPLEYFEDVFKCDLVITNAYLIHKYYGEDAIKQKIHSILKFSKTVMTDSGAYQILLYGYVDVSPDFIVEYQREIGSDIGVILDVPTGAFNTKYSKEWSVRETLRRAERHRLVTMDGDMLWVAPIQGGLDLELVTYSAKRVVEMNYDIYAIGSPTQVMENYRFDLLVDIIACVKSIVPPNKPVHLFGAGHPLMLSLAVAMGCDLFDSASYALYAREGRYMTPYGTIRVSELKELPCECPICSRISVEDLLEMNKEEKEAAIAQHNMYVLMAELRRIREAISEGTLWRLLESRCRSHPYMYRAYLKLVKYIKLLEKHDYWSRPLVRGVFLFDSTSVIRCPKVIRHLELLKQRYKAERRFLIIIPEGDIRPFEEDPLIGKFLHEVYIRRKLYKVADLFVLSRAFILVPIELSETFP
ncbi:MAG: tRNA guanosine(15) transglycosylase TgtA, partial [Thermoprotei archaeon]